MTVNNHVAHPLGPMKFSPFRRPGSALRVWEGVRVKPVLGGLHHEYWLEKAAA